MKKPPLLKLPTSTLPPLPYQHPFWLAWRQVGKSAYSPDLTRITGSVTAGILLSQILYWFGPTKKGTTKLRVVKQGVYWLAKSREEWQAETGLSFKQIKRAQDRLVELGIIEVALHRFDGNTHNHIRINQDVLLDYLQKLPPPTPKKKLLHPYNSQTSVADNG